MNALASTVTHGSSLTAVAADLLVPIDGRTPPAGVVLAVADGERVHVGAAGVADLDAGALVGPRHVQDVASVSKVLTTLAVLALVGRGELTLDSTLHRLLGDRAGVHGATTVEDLLRHRAGLLPWWPLYLEPDAAADPVAHALALPPLRGRDEERTYSDLGMQILGDVVARVAGLPFAAAVTDLVLRPLGATGVTPGAPAEGRPVLAGPDGDAIERDMVRSGVPYPVDRTDEGFAWRTHRIVAEPADGNAFHAFRGAAGHAGWFADVDGLLRIAAAIADPTIVGGDPAGAAALSTTVDPGQGLGLRRYEVRWQGRDRVLLGHPGFTGAFVGATPADDDAPPVRIALLANRLHGRPAPGRDALTDTDILWRTALDAADTIIDPNPSGDRP
jgi:CubicO group peptidase (beta-lactamase class C family)